MTECRHHGIEGDLPAADCPPSVHLGQVPLPPMRSPLIGELGEGVISTAIAVLIMAFIGAAMWAVFNGVFTDAGATIEQQVSEIGS